MTAKLYSISISHPSRAAGLMLRHKGMDFEIVDVPPGMQPLVLRLAGFRGRKVPGLKLDGRRVQGSLQIARALEELQPEPSLYPSDPQRRAAVEDAERWGEREFQPIPRRMFRWMAARDSNLRQNLARSTGMPAPVLTARAWQPLAWYFSRLSRANEETVRSALENLPGQLDHVDRLIGDGVIGNEQLNAADYQIATTARVLMNYPQLRPLIELRPAGELAMRVVPDFGREFPIQLPAGWVPAPASS